MPVAAALPVLKTLGCRSRPQPFAGASGARAADLDQDEAAALVGDRGDALQRREAVGRCSRPVIERQPFFPADADKGDGTRPDALRLRRQHATEACANRLGGKNGRYHHAGALADP
ncbi:MAG: hypothetical protein KGJ66_15580 [Alphaproteobacteria bacterium]|nr:hypothetical protein [Alphaproteobacteria bacterium]